ncbi:putative inactive dehydrogenase EasA [Mycena venus]|uniref:Putative inactive dehydrogenase EasA n=1 Tax=Mycena venus TaxID=2733690 RepID=A0A8H7D6D5_9AGAR|nr:putative inactive dehydrogenase EasA [Mycena venus]
MGRTADPAILAAEGLPFVSASDVPIAGQPTPRPLTVEEIKDYIQMYATAASNAVYRAGFDGVEIHAANGYFLDQFLHDRSNIRTDAYGGSVENRTRLPLEVTEAMVKAVGQKKTGFRISPWGTYNGTLPPSPYSDKSDIPLRHLCDRYPELACLHVVEPRVNGTESVEVVKDGNYNDFIRAIWGDRRLISTGGYTQKTTLAAAEEKGDLVVFARQYIANPDLPFRLHDIALAVGNRALYYVPGSVDPKGYTDYPFAIPVESQA